MKKKIYVVVCKGNTQVIWLGSLEKAKEYCKEYGEGNYSIHEYTYSKEVEKVEPKPLYKPLW